MSSPGGMKLVLFLAAFFACGAFAQGKAFDANTNLEFSGRYLQFEGCHCDGDTVHCNSANEEDSCYCEEGTAYCDLALLDTSKPWAEVIVASLIVNLVTLIGVVFIAGEWLRKLCCPSWQSGGTSHKLWTHVLIPMFACGALLATTFFLVLPEALLLIQSFYFPGGAHEGHDHRNLADDDHSGEAAATWRFGTAIIGGFLIPVVSHVIFPHVELSDLELYGEEASQDAATQPPGQSEMLDVNASAHSKAQSPEEASPEAPVDDSDQNQHTVEQNASASEEEKPAEAEEAASEGEQFTRAESFKHVVCGKPGENLTNNASLVASIFLGDFFHNFADGVFIGTAFLLCDRALAITITAATIFHELAQEVADYFMLVHHCGLTRVRALLLNFVCGLSIMLGAVIVLAADLNSAAIGIILCISGGVYVHLAVAECLTTAEKHGEGRKQKLYGILAFICGVVPIGLVLLNHQHCGGH